MQDDVKELYYHLERRPVLDAFVYEDISDIFSLEIRDNKIINQSNSSNVLGGNLISKFVHIEHKVETLVIVIIYEDFFKISILQKDTTS